MGAQCHLPWWSLLPIGSTQLWWESSTICIFVLIAFGSIFAGVSPIWLFFSFFYADQSESQLLVSSSVWSWWHSGLARFLYCAELAHSINNIQFFNAADYALLLSYARDLSDHFKWRMNCKSWSIVMFGKFSAGLGCDWDVGRDLCQGSIDLWAWWFAICTPHSTPRVTRMQSSFAEYLFSD